MEVLRTVVEVMRTVIDKHMAAFFSTTSAHANSSGCCVVASEAYLLLVGTQAYNHPSTDTPCKDTHGTEEREPICWKSDNYMTLQ